MIPVPKDKRDSNSDSSNYRAIAISSTLRKKSSLVTDDLLYGSKENSFTNIYTQVLTDTIEYYNSNNIDCYMLLCSLYRAFTKSLLQDQRVFI